MARHGPGRRTLRGSGSDTPGPLRAPSRCPGPAFRGTRAKPRPARPGPPGPGGPDPTRTLRSEGLGRIPRALSEHHRDAPARRSGELEPNRGQLAQGHLGLEDRIRREPSDRRVWVGYPGPSPSTIEMPRPGVPGNSSQTAASSPRATWAWRTGSDANPQIGGSGSDTPGPLRAPSRCPGPAFRGTRAKPRPARPGPPGPGGPDPTRTL